MKETSDTLLTKYERIAIHLDEKDKRIWCANESISLGWGGISKVSEVIGITRKTILKGVKELKSQEKVEENRVRKKGAGRKKAIDKDKELEKDIEICVESSTRGDPESPLIWTSKSTRNISNELNKESHRTSHSMVSRILIKKGYSLQSNKKTIEGGDNPDRNEQFEFINKKAKEFQSKNIPVISVDAKKKENIGNFKNNGKEYHKKGKAPDVNVYDFVDKEKGKVTPYGIYDLSQNNGWVSVGISSDTAKFAVNSIRSWWNELGIKSYIDAKEIYINADGGGSNGSRTRLWKTELQILSNELDKIIHVSHFPPGTSKWNKIEHKMFSFISKN
ncbi:MAG: ISAzo13 family transposase, partial [Ignavibacteria bacterium]|nr:ISAzo13 family transposase [Ignavibacteria bacterium]